MQYHEKYGQQIAQYNNKTKGTKVYLAVTGLILLVAVVLVAAVFMFINPGFFGFAPDDPISRFLPVGLAALCLAWVFILPKVAKMMQIETEGTIYENGMVLTFFKGTGPDTRKLECGFDEIKGIKHYTVRYFTAGVIPSKKHIRVIVHLKNKYQAYTGSSSVKAFNMNRSEYNLAEMYPVEFLEKILERYTNYLVKDLTKENITQAQMAFGEDLELRNGQFIYMGGQVVLPLNEVSRVTSDKLPFKADDMLPFMSSKINLRSIDDNEKEKKAISIPISDAMNVDALYYIINNLA